ncbi:FecR family protein [Niabella drilacis]|uniref:FecR family protein n=1 Tax=Niabella drilacis (strain DSM 25811 / CCM 8410 / CCUG 62505 / LMG 26954 / E90) TaxID=1285928 RepID=A0A1G6S8S5_NIADE|nr:FecR domain-containing protein [Niabella drilacis]SDD12555.1 FecR family protein [Niabella drilacis]
MNREQFLALLSKKMRNELSPGDREAFEEGMKENREYRQLYEAIAVADDRHPAVKPGMEGRLSAIWKRIGADEPIVPQQKRWLPLPLLRTAAVLLLAAGLIVFIRYTNKQVKEDRMLTLSTTNKKLYTTLPDGTQVTLNYHSTLEYNTGFGEEKRKIVLQGEAFFDVAENRKIPLQVLAGPLMVEVKGTAFGVNAYKDNPDISVILLRGSVEVSRRGSLTDKVLLKPRQWLRVPNSAGGMVQFSVDSVSREQEQQMHWKDDSLVFRKESLQQIVLKLEKKYGVTIEIKTAALKEKRFSGVFVNESLAAGLEALRMAYPFSYKIEEKKVTIQ